MLFHLRELTLEAYKGAYVRELLVLLSIINLGACYCSRPDKRQMTIFYNIVEDQLKITVHPGCYLTDTAMEKPMHAT